MVTATAEAPVPAGDSLGPSPRLARTQSRCWPRPRAGDGSEPAPVPGDARSDSRCQARQRCWTPGPSQRRCRGTPAPTIPAETLSLGIRGLPGTGASSPLPSPILAQHCAFPGVRLFFWIKFIPGEKIQSRGLSVPHLPCPLPRGRGCCAGSASSNSTDIPAPLLIPQAVTLSHLIKALINPDYSQLPGEGQLPLPVGLSPMKTPGTPRRPEALSAPQGDHRDPEHLMETPGSLCDVSEDPRWPQGPSGLTLLWGERGPIWPRVLATPTPAASPGAVGAQREAPGAPPGAQLSARSRGWSPSPPGRCGSFHPRINPVIADPPALHPSPPPPPPPPAPPRGAVSAKHDAGRDATGVAAGATSKVA